jgi:hypothetical protein
VRTIDTSVMTTLPGTNSAEALVAVRLPFDVIVQALIVEVGLTFAEATGAANAATDALREVDCVDHAHA